jgi:hypothetical protein
MENKVKNYMFGGIKLSVWTNKNEEGKEYNTYGIDKRYLDKEEWKDSKTFNENDLMKLRLLIEEVLRQKMRIL